MLVAALVPAIVGGLKALGVKEISEAMVIASLGVTAVAILSASLLMAVDIIARALVTRQAQSTAEAHPSTDDKGETDPTDQDCVRVERTTETRFSRG